MKIRFDDLALPKDGSLVIFAFKDKALAASAEAADKALDGAVNRAVAASRFKGGSGDSLVLPSPGDGRFNRVILLGLGKPEEFDALTAQNAGGRAVAALNAAGAASAAVLLDPVDGGKIDGAAAAARAGFGARLRSYRFDKYRTKEKPERKPTLTGLAIGAADAKAARKAFAPLAKLADGVFMTRNLVSEPANVIYPETLAAEGETLRELGVEVEVLGEEEMRKLGMGSLLGVGQGSTRESRLIVMQWRGGAEKDQPVAFIGKGVTFDTGGISIKPAGGMEDMKWDMGGSGVVIGLMKALAGRKAKCKRRRRRRAGREYAVRRGPAAGRYRDLHVRPDHRGAEHRRRGPARPGRRALVHPGPVQAEIHDRPGDAYRRDHHRAGQRELRPVLQQRRAGRADRGSRQSSWRAGLAHAAGRRLRQAARQRRRGHEEYRRARGRQHHRRPAPAAFRQRCALGASGHRRRDLEQEGQADRAKGGTAFGVQMLNRLVEQHYEG